MPVMLNDGFFVISPKGCVFSLLLSDCRQRAVVNDSGVNFRSLHSGCDSHRSREHRERLPLPWRSMCSVRHLQSLARFADAVPSGLMILAVIGFCCFSTTPYGAIDEAHCALPIHSALRP
jgi:hypothetical protein